MEDKRVTKVRNKLEDKVKREKQTNKKNKKDKKKWEKEIEQEEWEGNEMEWGNEGMKSS